MVICFRESLSGFLVKKKQRIGKRSPGPKSMTLNLRLSLQAPRLALHSGSSKNEEHTQELEKAKAKLKTIKAQGVDYSALSKGKEAPSAPIDDQTKLILSGLWLGACFFLQRVFEKFFQDKGNALLTRKVKIALPIKELDYHDLMPIFTLKSHL